MDWSVLRLHARFVFLRDELIYSSYIPVRFSSSHGLLSHHPDGTTTYSFTTFPS